MSRDKEVYEARRWVDTAHEDIDAARVLLDKQKFSHVCFFAHQAAEKALKALWISIGEDPWGHSLHKLITDMPHADIKTSMQEFIEESAVLDRYYIPTRYPNGLPDLTPGKYYFQKDATLCIESAERIINKVRKIIG